MAPRYWLVLALFAATVGVPLLLRPTGRPGLFPGAAVDTGWAAPAETPPEALAALEAGRYLKASRILREYLARTPHPKPEIVLLAARAEAGWSDWARVRTLLSGKPWLDTVHGGLGWELLGRAALAAGDWDAASRAFERYLRVAPNAGNRARGLAEFRRGRALAGGDRPAEAMAAYDSAARDLPQVADWMGLHGAAAAAEAGDTAAVAKRLAALPTDVTRNRAWRLRVRARLEAHDSAGARAEALAASTSLSSASERAGALEQAGNLALAARDTTAARSLFRRAVAASPGASGALSAARALVELGHLSTADRLHTGDVLLRHGDVTRGVRELRAYISAARPSTAERVRLEHRIGNALFGAGRYPEAETPLRYVVAHGSAGTAASALYTIARAQYRNGHEARARGTLDDVAEQFPHANSAASALFLLGDLDQDDGRTDRARGLFERVIKFSGDVDEVGKAYMRLGAMAFVEGDDAGSARVYEEYRRRFPHGQRWEEATYWAARAYLRMGKKELAHERLREIRRTGSLSYYALKAGDLLDQPLWSAPLAAAPAPDSAAAARIAPTIERIGLLRELDLDDAAAHEVDAARDRFDSSTAARYELAEALDSLGYTVPAIRIGYAIHRQAGAWNPRLLRIVYPFPYRGIVSAEAKERGLDPYLVAGLIRQESAFNATARSGAGAIGLMQVMPGTGHTLARAAGVKSFDADMLRRPELNVMLGTAFVSDLLDSYRVPQMLAAYNAGPSRVDRWQKLPEARDPELFTERIPFDETRGYVKIVQTNARIYQELYPQLLGEAAVGK